MTVHTFVTNNQDVKQLAHIEFTVTGFHTFVINSSVCCHAGSNWQVLSPRHGSSPLVTNNQDFEQLADAEITPC